MKLKCTDLRIGNIVSIKDTGEIVCVCTITNRKVGFHAPNERPNAQLRYRRLHEIGCIPIYDHLQKIECPRLTWCDNEDSDEVYLYFYNTYPHKTFRYIHELQNIHYALTGEELKIEL